MNVPVIFGMLLEMINNKRVKAVALSEKFEVSTRTVFRYINVLAEAGVPIMSETGRNGGFSIMPNYKLDGVYFSRDEMRNLTSALEVLKVNYPHLADFDVLSAKLNAVGEMSTYCNVLTSEKIVIDGGAWGDLKRYRDKACEIERAIDERHGITIEYHDRGNTISVREIDPYIFILKDAVWYVYAYCHLRAGFRTFKLSRIAKIVPSKRSIPERPFPKNKPWTLEFEHNEPTFELVLRCGEKARYDVEEWLGIEAIKYENGSYYARAELKENAELIGKLLSFGNNIEIVSPKRIKDRILKICAAVIATSGAETCGYRF